MGKPLSIDEKNAGLTQIAQAIRESTGLRVNTAVPAIVQAFDPARQTAVLRPAIRRRMRTKSGYEEVEYPELHDVPVCFLGGGSYALTFPVQPGDEALVIFADVCIDAWFQSGGVQGQISLRNHDLSDGFAIVGFRSQPKMLPQINTEKPYISELVVGEFDLITELSAVKNFVSEWALLIDTLAFDLDDDGYMSVTMDDGTGG